VVTGAELLGSVEDIKEVVNTTINFHQQPPLSTFNGAFFSS